MILSSPEAWLRAHLREQSVQARTLGTYPQLRTRETIVADLKELGYGE
ncbi:MAG: hypothetical protein LC781_12515 [Actinobacteria bacterium]|nr:hypothetical protein [Actinomycetota bacterium]